MNAVRAAASGRGRPAGGIALVRSLRTTFSQVSAPAATSVDAQRVERQPAGLQPLVVARHAVPLHDGLMRVSGTAHRRRLRGDRWRLDGSLNRTENGSRRNPNYRSRQHADSRHRHLSRPAFSDQLIVGGNP